MVGKNDLNLNQAIQDESILIQTAEAFLKQEVSPHANAMDSSEPLLAAALQGLCDRGLMALKRPHVYGGPELSETNFRLFQRLVARTSGALSFLQTQHQSAISLLVKSDNEDLKQRVLPNAHLGGELIGIAISQLRRKGPPCVVAEPVDGGYLINGHFPWATGHRYFKSLLIGATLPNDTSVFGLVPFEVAGQLVASAPMQLAAMQSARTVTLEATNLFLPAENVLFVKPKDWGLRADLINIALQGYFAAGCAWGSLDIVHEMAAKKRNPTLSEAATRLQGEYDNLVDKMNDALAKPDETSVEDRLAVRAWAIELSVRAAHAAITATGGSANSLQHPAQRLYREALVYTVSAQTEAIMEATLKRLAR